MSAPLKHRTPVDENAYAHGGDVDAVAREYGIPAEALVDFSASINPLGPPARVLARLRRDAADASLLARYPDPRYSELRTALAAHAHVPPKSLAIANGAAALCGAVIRTLTPGTCVLAVPAFAEQHRALDAAGWSVSPFSLTAADGFRLDAGALCERLETVRPALCLLTNPHNPSGALTTAAEMIRVVRAAAACGTWLAIDEAFIDYAPSESLTVEATRWVHLVILRSLTKFYGMPALRVGFSVSMPQVAARIDAQLPAWPVTTLAAAAGVEAVRDLDYTRRTLLNVADERRRLAEALATIGVETYASAANFLLLRLPGRLDSARVREQLISDHRIVVRDCRSFHGLSDGRFVRVAVRSSGENGRLVRALHSVVEDASLAS